MTADERRAEILRVAIGEFAALGLHGSSTETIAERAEISQPYIFRLFGTKKDLFIAALEQVWRHILHEFQEAVRDDPEHPLDVMGQAFIRLLGERQELLVMLHGYAASDDQEVCDAVRQGFKTICHFVQPFVGEDEKGLQQFLAHGMLLMVAAAMDLPAIAETEDWARMLLIPSNCDDPEALHAALTRSTQMAGKRAALAAWMKRDSRASANGDTGADR